MRKREDPHAITAFRAVSTPAEAVPSPPEAASTASWTETRRAPRPFPIWRGLLVGLLLTPLNAFWIITIEAVQFGPYPTTLSLLANVLFWLLLLHIGNGVVRRVRPGWALTQADLLAVYTTLAAGSAMAGCDLLQILMHYIGHVGWTRTFQPEYSAAWEQYVPRWLTVTDPEALRGYYSGNSTLYTLAHLRAWALPIASWMLFIALMGIGMMCLNSLLRRRWVEQERLPFPLVMLPLEMTNPTQRLWRNRLLWAGFLLAGGIDLLNGFAVLYPSLPSVPINYIVISTNFKDKPWSAMGWTTISFYPIILGIGYLLPLDLLFSCWFFFLFWKAQLVFCSAMGWDIAPEFPYVNYQSFGALMMLGVMTLWGARQYLAMAWRCAVGRPSELSDAGEAISYRAALIGFAVSFVGLIVFCHLAGLQWKWTVVFFVLYWLALLTVTRMRAELGAPVHDLINAAPEVVLTDVLGPRAFTPRDLTVFSLFYWFSKLHRSDVMPHGMEVLKMADNARANRRQMFWTFLMAMLVGSLAGFWGMLHQGYALGNAARWGFPAYAGWETFNRLNSWLDAPKMPNQGMGFATVVGALTCFGLFLLRRQFLWWPLHPICYAITATFEMNIVWLPLLIAWAVKGVVLRFGGRTLYHRLIPFFYGLILGQAVVGSLWSLASVATGQRMYSFWGY
ncbi:MAG TPA: DUF6785 family protein [Chthonomonadaceae bacterium]|nr:DUF6785 family protein [Chthonomonadaceae bacterium]